MAKFSETREKKKKVTFPHVFNREELRRDARQNKLTFPATVQHKGRVTKSSKKK